MAKKLTLAEEIEAFFQLKEEAKTLYARSDALLVKLAGKIKKAGGSVLMPDGKKAIVKNNWARQTVTWGHGASRKWEIKLVDATE